VGTFGFPAAELVHEDDPIAELGEVLKGQKIVVCGSRPSMKTEDGPFRRRPVGAIEKVESQSLHEAFRRFHATTVGRNTGSTDDRLGGDPLLEIEGQSFRVPVILGDRNLVGLTTLEVAGFTRLP
jgi:hypothetical protein